MRRSTSLTASAPSAMTSEIGPTSACCRRVCAGEPYGVSRLGDEGSAQKITTTPLPPRPTALSMPGWSFLCCGSAEPQRVEEAVEQAFAAPAPGAR